MLGIYYLYFCCKIINLLGIKEQMISMFSYRINKDKRFYTIEVFEVPSIELIELCDSYNCKLMANILNKKMNIGNLIRW